MNNVNTAEKLTGLTTNIINIDRREPVLPYQMPTMACMAAHDSYTENLYQRTAEQQDKGNGMDAFPEEVFNAMIEHCLHHGKIRDAMYLICSANWGTRYSDTVRVRYCHLFDSNGKLRESFTLPYGEKKTGKLNIYYNNEATAKIISLYLQMNPNKTPYDYLFVSESGRKSKAFLKDIEADELYGFEIYKSEKQVENLKSSLDRTTQSYINNVFTPEEYKEIIAKIKERLAIEEENLNVLKEKYDNYISPNPEAENIRVVKPISAQAAENIIKDTLADLGLFPKNKKKSETGTTNLDCKLNTHSFRKTFGEFFYRTGCELRESGELNIDPTMLNLLQQKFMHSSIGTTNRYNTNSEKAFRVICTHMNTGLGVLDKYNL